VRAFQASRGLTPSGVVDGVTWKVLLRRAPRPVDWSRRGNPALSPTSASLDALRFEVPLTPGRP
jgi:peptidoglycan hydrolase-like protein with peptidoglycan-binding domain